MVITIVLTDGAISDIKNLTSFNSRKKSRLYAQGVRNQADSTKGDAKDVMKYSKSQK